MSAISFIFLSGSIKKVDGYFNDEIKFFKVNFLGAILCPENGFVLTIIDTKNNVVNMLQNNFANNSTVTDF